MRRSFPGRLIVTAIILTAFLCLRAADQSPAVREAVASMRRGDFRSAEKTLRTEVQAHASDSWALSLLGVALDNQKKFPEADEFHLRAVALCPRTPQRSSTTMERTSGAQANTTAPKVSSQVF